MRGMIFINYHTDFATPNGVVLKSKSCKLRFLSKFFNFKAKAVRESQPLVA